MRTDPRVRQTLNQISENLESVNETAQASLFIFIQNYLGPCVSSVGSCIESCTGPCFPNRDERLRRNRGRRRGRAEYGFDFYDDWDDDDGARDALLGWDNDELNRLLVGSGDPPAGERVMSYGAQDGNLPAQRRPKLGPSDGRADATLPHASALWTFVERLPWKIGGKGLKYKPSAADLQPRPGVHRSEEVEEEPLLAESADGNAKARTNGTRARSDTTGSGGTTDSLSSRGDLFPSEDEDDAVPLDDEFAMVLERRAARSTTDENSSRKTRGKRSTGSHSSARTASSKATRTSSHQSQPSSDLVEPSTRHVDVGLTHAPSLADLDKEEDRLRREEEVELERRREAAKHLALQRGLTAEDSADMKELQLLSSQTDDVDYHIPPTRG
ncbi:MAG: hypothetical protein M1838_000923 [Thelocarpon superellum]|nr:MAG: hypothetical protein M1838_000923 [Thelocarpon superellum]